MLLLLLLFPLVVLSQFSMVDGLSQNTVFSAVEDCDKNMWFATYNGVNRYDGYQFFVYQTQKDPDFVQVSGADPFVFVDSRGDVWAYDGGINRFDEICNAFVLCDGILCGAVTDMAESPSGNILVVSGGRIVEIDRQTFGRVSSPGPLASLDNVAKIACSAGIMAIGTTDGHLMAYRSEDVSLIDDFLLGTGAGISDIFIKSPTEIWALSDVCGPVRIDLKSLSSKVYIQSASRTRKSFVKLAQDNHGSLYLVSPSSLFKLNAEEDRFLPCQEVENFPNSIRDIHFDSDDGIWIGTYRSGVYYGCLKENPVSRINLFEGESDFVICSIAEDKDGHLWISTQNEGVFIYDVSKGIAKPFLEAPPVLSGGIMTMTFDEKRQKTYFGNNGGITIYDWKTKRSFSIGSYENINLQAYSFARENFCKIWVGTLSGLYLFDTETESLEKIPGTEKLFIYRLLRDNQNILWVATSEGLFRTTLNSDKDGNPHCGPFERCSDAVEVHDLQLIDGSLAVAARNGLFIIGKDGASKHYDISDGLTSNYLNGIEVDYSGKIWLGTENGMNCFDPDNLTIVKYYASDGPGLDYYTKNAHCRTSDGRLFWGGVNGLCCVDPSVPRPDLCSENPVISAFYVNDMVRDITGNQIVLKNYENSLRFVLSVPNYSSRDKSTFCCRLCGLDEKWRDCGQTNSISWHSLKPGEYRFEMYSRNKNFTRSADTLTLKIKILRPWFVSKLALAMYSVFVVVGMILGISILRRREKKRTDAAVEEVRKETRYEIDKLRLLNLTGRVHKPEDSQFLINLLDVVEANISNADFSVEDLAGELCMSRSNLFLRVKNIVGDSASHLIRVVRINKACQLMIETNKNIEEIAFLTGYSSGASFSTSFKKEKGVSPQEWKNMGT